MVGKKSAFRSIHQTMHWLIVVFIGILVYPQPAAAQQDTDQSTWEMEEVVVIGTPLLIELRKQVIQAEEFKFELFNSLNSTDEFDITCEYRAPLGSRIERRVCNVGYMMKARSEDAHLFLTRGIQPRSDSQLAVTFAHKTEALNREMVELGSKHPSLAKAMIREYELKQRYLLERRERFKVIIFPQKHTGQKSNRIAS